MNNFCALKNSRARKNFRIIIYLSLSGETSCHDRQKEKKVVEKFSARDEGKILIKILCPMTVAV